MLTPPSLEAKKYDNDYYSEIYDECSSIDDVAKYTTLSPTPIQNPAPPPLPANRPKPPSNVLGGYVDNDNYASLSRTHEGQTRF